MKLNNEIREYIEKQIREMPEPEYLKHEPIERKIDYDYGKNDIIKLIWHI